MPDVLLDDAIHAPLPLVRFDAATHTLHLDDHTKLVLGTDKLQLDVLYLLKSLHPSELSAQ